jgi:hypothetical protein
MKCPLCGRKMEFNNVDKKWHCIGSLFCGYESKPTTTDTKKL